MRALYVRGSCISCERPRRWTPDALDAVWIGMLVGGVAWYVWTLA